jgi:hypothetical protein
MNPRQIIIEEARRAGVDPAVALSIWEQESGGSTDLSVRGPVLPSGKWKGHYARGPWQIMSFHGDIPNDFRGQTRWAMQHLKERGVRGYYGTGNPVVPGHPTTDQYEAEVLGRAGKIDPRTASTEIGAPAVSPHSLPSRSVATPDTYPSNLGQQVLGRSLGLLNPQPRERRLSDDLMAMGLGILNSKGGNWFGAGLGAMRQDRQAAQQQAIDQQRANAYNAQTMLQALNQMGYTTPDVYEQSRSREPTTFVNPQTGELISGFVNRLTARGEDYEGNPIPSRFIDVNELPQQAEDQPLGDPWAVRVPGGPTEYSYGPPDLATLPAGAEIGRVGTMPKAEKIERGGRDEWVTAMGPDGPVTVRESIYDPGVHGPIINTPSYSDVVGGGGAKGGGRDEWVTAVGPDGPVTVRESEYDPAVHGPMTNTPSYKDVAGGPSGAGSKIDLVKLDAAISQIEQMELIMFGDPEQGVEGAFTKAGGEEYEGVFGRIGKGVANWWNKQQQEVGTSAAIYERQLASLAGTLAKAFGDTGTLSEGDVKRALDSMPRADNYPDVTSFARDMYSNLLNVLREKRRVAAGESTPPTMDETPPQEGDAPPRPPGEGWELHNGRWRRPVSAAGRTP